MPGPRTTYRVLAFVCSPWAERVTHRDGFDLAQRGFYVYVRGKHLFVPYAPGSWRRA